MADQKKLDKWAEKLLDTGKKNNLISYKDPKASSAEIIYPDCDRVFSKCSVGHVFDVFDPKIADDDIPTDESDEANGKPKVLSRNEYFEKYRSRIRNEKTLLLYAQTPNPLAALKNIGKKAQDMLDETGNNVAYLVFGFVRWCEKEDSSTFYRAPLLLVHANIRIGSVVDPIRIEISDDDVVVNPTFSYMLQAQYGLTLPEFGDDDSLDSYFERVLDTVKKLGWSVLKECKVGIFSFLKINMYEDLKKNADKILENENVLALLGDSETAVSFSSDDVSHVVEDPLIDLHTVVNADSSQIEAIEMAKSGKSFVLQGPPGTGKSQTITNIIAECLYDGKKVLFVSEKQAALNVVFDKLKKVGLSDFCLELHSHKANKKDVIDELIRTLEMPTKEVSSSTEEEIRLKKDAKNKLDEYADELHKNREKIDKSLYQLYELFSAQRNYPDVPIVLANIQDKGRTYYNDAVKYLEQYVEYVPTVGKNYKENAWYGFNNPGISFDESNQLRLDMEMLLKNYRSLVNDGALNESGIPESSMTLKKTVEWASVLKFVAEIKLFTPLFFTKEAEMQYLPQIEVLRDLSTPILSNREAVLLRCSDEILEKVDGKDVYTRLTGKHKSIISRLGAEYKNTLSSLQAYMSVTNKLKYEDAVSISKHLMDYQKAVEAYRISEEPVRAVMGSGYKGPETEWDTAFASIETLLGYMERYTDFFERLSEMNFDEFAERQRDFEKQSQFITMITGLISEIQPRVVRNFNEAKFSIEGKPVTVCVQCLERCVLAYDYLGTWNSFMEVMKCLNDLELSQFIDTVIEQSIEPHDIVGSFKRLFFKYWIEYIKYSVPEIGSFSRVKQDQAVKTFSAKDKLQFVISRAQIQSFLSKRRPKMDLVAGGSEVAILRREGQKKRKQMPIRKLLDETAGLTQDLKPCFLMSPLSVSTYLDSGKISFDTVVFDEASQIFPQDAIGAIYRGKQLIVVGDSRQMPPTNFFAAALDSDDDDEDETDVAAFESILDICSSVFNTERLAWHYRSHYEQLIAFSNLHFYNNHLVTFPSASTDHPGIGVDYHYVDGIFDRKAKSNRIEAEYIVDQIFKNFDEYPDRSLGVVAFSMSQQNLIDKLLSKRREENTDYEEFFSKERPEPFFIKNLETVQGDERDTIIFSVAYAKDSTGRFIQNFGPLNREGGERRLNVAVTRAKENVQLVASIHASDINLANTGSEGVRLLRAYLDYAQHGEVALESAITVSGEDQFDSFFEEEVCDFLRDNGFTVDTQVGCSGYRIDLGLRKPNSSDYLLAIECDGATYHSSKNARDRDLLRQSVLENMGWKFYRIWSTDWYKNKTVEKENLLRVAKNAIDGKQLQPEVESDDDNGDSSSSEKTVDMFTKEVKPKKLEFLQYKEINAMVAYYKNGSSFWQTLREILEKEAPLSIESLKKRMVHIYGREKVTQAVSQQFDSDLLYSYEYGIIRRDGFLYLQDVDIFPFRVPGDRREIKNIAIEELQSGILILIGQNRGVTKDNLFKLLINILGFNRSSEAMVLRLDRALSQLIAKGQVREENGQLSLS